MARAVTAGWVSGQGDRSRLRLYHVAFMLVTMLAAVAITIPSVVGETTIYRSQATIVFDPAQLPGLVEAGKPTAALINSEQEIGEILKADFPNLGSRTTGFSVQIAAAGRIEVTGLTPDQSQARDLAMRVAEKLTRRMYGLIGDPVLHEVLSRQAWEAVSRNAVDRTGGPLLSDLLLASAVDNVQPRRDARTIEQLNAGERFALTRRLEVLDDLKTLAVRSADVAQRQAQTPTAQTDARERMRGATAAQKSIEALLQYLYRTYHTTYDPVQANSAYIQTVPTPGVAIKNYGSLKLLIAALVGLGGGLLTVAIDRSIGIVPTLLDLWRYREMVRNVVGRDLKARYKNSLLGYFWSLLNPLLMMIIFWAVFGLLLRNDIPQFPVFLIVGLLPWNYAVTSVSGGMRAIIDNSNLVKKVYFPRAILPITTVLSNLVNYLLALPVMFAVMFAVQYVSTRHIVLSWTFVYLPVLLVIQTIFLIGMTLLLSTMAVFFRDTTHIVDILIQLWLFITPVFFSLTAVTHGNYLAARVVRWINPMASLVDFYRDVLYGHPVPNSPVPAPPSLPALDGVFRTLVTALVILAFGAYVFQHNSSRFGEEL